MIGSTCEQASDAIGIIIAAGDGKRWNNHLGKNKHFIEIGGETLIRRTVRLARKYVSEIYVVANSADYQVAGATLFFPKLNPLNRDADKFLSSISLWNKTGRTVVFYGDVYFSEAAMKCIMEYQPKERALFARFGASELTGKKYGECFAHSFYSEHNAELGQHLHKIMSAHSRGEIDRSGGWELYRSLEQIPLKEHLRKNRFVEINDWTEDFDYPSDYDQWRVRFHFSQLDAMFPKNKNMNTGNKS